MTFSYIDLAETARLIRAWASMNGVGPRGRIVQLPPDVLDAHPGTGEWAFYAGETSIGSLEYESLKRGPTYHEQLQRLCASMTEFARDVGSAP